MNNSASIDGSSWLDQFNMKSTEKCASVLKTFIWILTSAWSLLRTAEGLLHAVPTTINYNYHTTGLKNFSIVLALLAISAVSFFPPRKWDKIWPRLAKVETDKHRKFERSLTIYFLAHFHKLCLHTCAQGYTHVYFHTAHFSFWPALVGRVSE